MEEEENTDGKRKTVSSSLPANYISIVQLQERWFNEKDRKQKEEEEEERRRKQLIEEEQRVIEEEDLEKSEIRKLHEDLSENRLNRSNRKKNSSGNRKKKEESMEARCVEVEQPDATAAIGSERGVDSATIVNGLLEKKKKFKKRYKKKYKDAVTVEEKVVECESIAQPENNTPVAKEAKPPGKRRVVHREKAVKALETQFEDLSINRGEERGNMKSQSRSRHHNRPMPRQFLQPPRRNRTSTETATMVWVKKGENERAYDGIGNGVKALNA